MAERRMFSKSIIGSDAFLDMPQSTQALYFHLAMRGDDDGFINSPKSIMRTVGCKDDDLKLLAAKKFIIPFESGVIVIKHWRIHNYIAKDRYHETKYKNELAMLGIDENGSYTMSYTGCIQDVHKMETEVRLGKDRIGEDREEEEPSAPRPGLTTSLQLAIIDAWDKMPSKVPKPYGANGTQALDPDVTRALTAIRGKHIPSDVVLTCIGNYCEAANWPEGDSWIGTWVGVAKFFEGDMWQHFRPDVFPASARKRAPPADDKAARIAARVDAICGQGGSE